MYKLIFFFATVFCCCCSPVTKTIPPATQVESQQGEKASISFRIAPALSLPGNRFTELLDLFDKYKGVTDEITLFTQVTHSPLPLDSIVERMAVLKERMEQARKRGYRSGINILTTLGHHSENLDYSLQGDVIGITNIDGEAAKGSFCPNGIAMQQYIKNVYKVVASSNPDYIWIDDDVRLGHMPVGLGCFCNNCLNLFKEQTGKYYSREELKTAFDNTGTTDKLAVREQWLQHNRTTISKLFELIEKTVREIKPDMPLGFMTGDRFYEGYDFDNWATTLAGPGNKKVMWRPGGGYYNDQQTGGLVGKSHDIGRQVAVLPKEVAIIQSEIECFPYQRLHKAANMIALEACSHIAAGCTGTAFNVFTMYNEPLVEYELLISKLHKTRPFYNKMVNALARTEVTGIQTFWNKSSAVTGNLFSGHWLSMGNPVQNHVLYDIGLPATYSNKKPAVTLLAKDNVFALSRQEIKQLLSTAVYMDAETLQQLNDLGFGDMTGFKVARYNEDNRIEKFTHHPINKGFEGRERDNRQSFYKSKAYTLEKTNDKAEVLSSLIDYPGNVVAPVTMGIFENQEGGRICVTGYYPWTFLENLSKSSQVKSVFRWLSRDQLPGYIASFHKINLWIRQTPEDKVALALTNSSFDEAGNVLLKLRTHVTALKVYDMDMKTLDIKMSEDDGVYKTFVIPSIAPWQMKLVTSQ